MVNVASTVKHPASNVLAAANASADPAVFMVRRAMRDTVVSAWGALRE
jgi:hypothetical protein